MTSPSERPGATVGQTEVVPRYERQALREEIATTRADLGDTIQALADKMDVKARLRQATTDARHRASGRARGVAQRTRATAWEVAHQTAVFARRYRGPLLAVAATTAAIGVYFAVRRRR